MIVDVYAKSDMFNDEGDYYGYYDTFAFSDTYLDYTDFTWNSSAPYYEDYIIYNTGNSEDAPFELQPSGPFPDGIARSAINIQAFYSTNSYTGILYTFTFVAVDSGTLTQTALRLATNVGDIVVTVQSAATKYPIAIDDTITNGAVTSDVDEATEGDPVTLTVTPDEGYSLQAESLSVTPNVDDLEQVGTSNQYTFTMPDEAVTVTASFLEDALSGAILQLQDAITQAETALGVPGTDYKISTDGKDVANDIQWVSQGALDTYQAAIQTAKDIEESLADALTGASVAIGAKETLDIAKSTFEAALKSGTYTPPVTDLAELAIIKSIPAQTYTGKALSPAVTLTAPSGIKAADYTVSYKNNTNAGIATVTITAKSGGKYTGSKSVNFTIKPASISVAKVAAIGDKVYNKKAHKPAVSVKHGSTALKEKTHYTVTHSSRTAIGKATITIKGKGNYTGSKTVSFKIVPAKTTVTKAVAAKRTVKATFKKISGTTKYEVRYRASGTSKWTTKTAAGSATSYTIKSLKKGKSYQIQVRSYKTVSGVKYYSDWSGTKTSGKVK